jgi:Ser/Thr protein kinase RdoA (MazF antagonist)
VTSEPADIASVADRFDFSGAVRDVQPITTGHINDSYRVTCEDAAGALRAYFLQRLNTLVFPRPDLVMQNIERVTRHIRGKLEATGSAAPERGVLQLIRTRDGELWTRTDSGDVWRAYDFIGGTRMQAAVRTAADAETAGAAFGRFQAQLADLPAPPLHESLPDFHHTPRRYEALDRALSEADRERSRAARDEIDAVQARRDVAGALVDLLHRGALPTRAVHNDAKLSNVLLDEETGGALAVVDLDLVMPGTALFDYGDMLRAMTTDAAEDEPDTSKVKLRLDLFEALTRGYLRYARSFLTQTEREHLLLSGRIITLEQAVRFLTDYLVGDRYYRTTRPGQNLERARTQLKLLLDMEAQEAAMQRRLEELLVPAEND